MKLFGQKLRVRFEFELEDGTSGTGKTDVEAFGVGWDEVEQYLKNALCVETGKRATKLKITATV